MVDRLQEQSIGVNDQSISVEPAVVVLKMGIPQCVYQ